MLGLDGFVLAALALTTEIAVTHYPLRPWDPQWTEEQNKYALMGALMSAYTLYRVFLSVVFFILRKDFSDSCSGK